MVMIGSISGLNPVWTTQLSTNNTLFVLTWDEDKTYSIPNQILTISFGPAVNRSASTDNTKYDLYSTLKSIEENWNFGNLGEADVNVVSLTVKDKILLLI